LRADGRLHVADGERADAIGGREIALEQRRRHAEQIGVVVEAVRGIVGWQQRRNVDVEIEQIANRIRILGAVQPPQCGAHPRCRGLCIELRLEPCGEPFVSIKVGAPLRAERRHRARAQLADDGFPGIGMRFDTGRVEIREGKAAVEVSRVMAAGAVLVENGRGFARPHAIAACHEQRER